MADAEVETKRSTIVWPLPLYTAMRDRVGPRGLTEFVVAAVEQHLGAAPGLSEASNEVGDLRHLCQLLADRVAMGGDDDMRREALMELAGLPEWFETTGWPVAMAALVRPVVEPSSVAPSELEVQTPVQIREDVPAAAEGERADLFAAVARKTGIDLEPNLKAALVPASEIAKPEEHHNHAWERTEGILCCTCGAWIDDGDPAYPQGIVRDENYGAPSMTLTVEAPTLAEPAAVVAVVESEPLCPKCQDELVGGECWNCA